MRITDDAIRRVRHPVSAQKKPYYCDKTMALTIRKKNPLHIHQDLG